MTGSLKDILSHLSKDIDQETLLLYLQDKLPAEKKHEVEKYLLDNDFADAALEGLREFNDQRQIQATVEQLNADLRKRLEKKRRRREKLRYREQPWLYISIIIVLLLVVIGYIIVHKAITHP